VRRLIGYKVKLVLRKKESSSAARGSRRKKKIHRPQRKIKKNDLLPVLRQANFFGRKHFICSREGEETIEQFILKKSIFWLFIIAKNMDSLDSKQL
jgi:hypothetical protein